MLSERLLAVEFLYCYAMCMAEAEIKVLGPKLSEILSTIRISDENRITVRKFNTTSEVAFGSPEYKEAVERVNEELARWLKAHQVANKYDIFKRVNLFTVRFSGGWRI